LLFALLGVSYIQAVVVGPQQLHNNNKNGYRYNGPAHKYLPSEEPHSHGSNLDSASDLGHGHRQQAFNGPYSSQYYEGQQQQGQEHQQHQQQRKESWNSIQGQQPEQYERQEAESWQSSQGHGYQQQQHQQFNQQQHQQQQQQHNRYGQQQLPLRGDLWQPIRELDLEKLPSAEAIANSHKTITAPGRDVKLVPSYTLSSDFEHDRFIGLDAQDTRLLTQSLPDAYRKQLFSSPSGPSSLGQRQHEQQLSGSSAYGGSHGGSLGGSHGGSLGGSSSDFLQMQSHSYQLPSTHSTHREWPQDKEQQQQHGSQQLVSGNRQYSASAYAVSPPHLHSSQPSQSSKNSLTHPSRDFQPPYY